MKYVAFFRGINVGGKNKVKMDELKRLFSDCGFSDIKTYIQSGNVLFQSDQDQALLADTISGAFEKRFGFVSHIILRSADEIAAILSPFPFTEAEVQRAEASAPEVAHVYIYLSNDPIDATALEKLRQSYTGDDKLYVSEREVYLLCHQSVRDSKLAILLSKLPAPLTARNQKTMCKVFELLTGD
ncbi:DUF1697 domain-containing protein [Christensenellaceae bacterium OttesenSCG-928-M15]|nr:DUF1697 domain-containing protein [Christensenellaceae bacterium OttesenSCG-928-M15]